VIVGKPPTVKKYIIVVAPHTSNWDFFIFVLLKFHFKLKVNFIGKHTIFIGPIGWLLRKMGGIPVVRSKSHNVVDSIVTAFKQNQEMIFALSPEGTRSYKNHWKSGFYHIALNADVPIQLCYLDKKTLSLGFGPLIKLSGDRESDMDLISKFYSTKQGIRPSLFSKICFKDKNINDN
jgi:1-acyl-sn-glycerol-3-phosphate acyltransferase